MGIKRQSLGKGLDALMGDYVNLQDDQKDGFKERVNADREIRDIPIEFLKRGKYQPRKDYNSKALDELAHSIGEQGIVQPIIIREVQQGAYEIVAGERRWLAAQRAGLETVPAIVREIDDRTAIAMALVENIQRENLNPMEESEALIRLQDEFHLTQQEIDEAELLGTYLKDRDNKINTISHEKDSISSQRDSYKNQLNKINNKAIKLKQVSDRIRLHFDKIVDLNYGETFSNHNGTLDTIYTFIVKWDTSLNYSQSIVKNKELKEFIGLEMKMINISTKNINVFQDNN